MNKITVYGVEVLIARQWNIADLFFFSESDAINWAQNNYTTLKWRIINRSVI